MVLQSVTIAPLTFAAAVLLSALVGCSSPDRSPSGASVSPADKPEAATPEQPIGVNAGGVTTRVDIPAESTEEQYAQACMAAKDWMVAKGGDPQALVEPYLQEVQRPGFTGPATFGSTWVKLRDPQRAAVIIAVRAAADGGC